MRPLALVLPALLAVVSITLFVLPITDVRWWTLDYALFLAFVLSIPALIGPGAGTLLRVVVVLGFVTYGVVTKPFFPVNGEEEMYVPGALDIVLLGMGVLVFVFARNTQRVRGLIILFALAYFGCLQAACPRVPGALELILLHLFDDHTIVMHVIKVSVVVVAGIIFGRYYCGWICPKGVIQEYIYRKRYKFTVPATVDKVLKYGKYLMLVALIVCPLAFEFQLFRHIGPFRVIFNLDGTLYVVVFLGIVLLTSVFIERAYCRYFCPEGGLLALAQIVSPYRVRLDTSTCTKCGRCTKVCPVDAFTLDERGKSPLAVSKTECIACLECQSACRDGSLVYGLTKKRKSS